MKLSPEVTKAIESFNQRKREASELEAKLQSSSTRLGELRTELSRLDHEKIDSAKARKAAADQLVTGGIDETAFTETRKQYIELSEKIDETSDLMEAFERAVDELQRKLNDAKAHVGIARNHVMREYAKQIQGELKAKCGDLIMLGLAAKHGGGSQTGRDAMGYFLCGALTGNENQLPGYELVLKTKSEIEKRLGIDE